MEFRGKVPVREGDEIDVKIEAVGEKGDGIAKIQGFVIFVPNTKQGDEVKIKVNRVLKSVGFGEVVGKASGNFASAPKEEYSKPKEEEEQGYEDTEDFGEDEEEEP